MPGQTTTKNNLSEQLMELGAQLRNLSEYTHYLIDQNKALGKEIRGT